MRTKVSVTIEESAPFFFKRKVPTVTPFVGGIVKVKEGYGIISLNNLREVETG